MSNNYDPGAQGSLPQDQSKSDALKVNPDTPASNLEAPALNLFLKWLKVTTRPGVASFTGEAPTANWTAILLGTLIYGAFLFVLILGLFTIAGVSTDSGFTYVLSSTAFNITLALAKLLLVNAVVYLLARFYAHGDGSYLTQAYLYSLYAYPLGMLTALVGLIPAIGGILDLVIAIYALFLFYYMLQAAHRISPSYSRALILLFIVILIVLFIVIRIIFGEPGYNAVRSFL